MPKSSQPGQSPTAIATSSSRHKHTSGTIPPHVLIPVATLATGFADRLYLTPHTELAASSKLLAMAVCAIGSVYATSRLPRLPCPLFLGIALPKDDPPDHTTADDPPASTQSSFAPAAKARGAEAAEAVGAAPGAESMLLEVPFAFIAALLILEWLAWKIWTRLPELLCTCIAVALMFVPARLAYLKVPRVPESPLAQQQPRMPASAHGVGGADEGWTIVSEAPMDAGEEKALGKASEDRRQAARQRLRKGIKARRAFFGSFFFVQNSERR